MSIYIQSASHISIQKPLSEEWMEMPIIPDSTFVKSEEPDYKPFISPMEARRMGTLVKRALATSLDTLRKGGCEMPDAIISGTGLGCVEHTEKFLNAVIDNDEECLPPTSFMQSTHNTISSQIALRLKCHGYNSTYSQGADSMASALLDAWLQLKAGKIRTALVGCHDEITPATADYPVPDGSLALVLEAVPFTKTAENENGEAKNGLPCTKTAQNVNGMCEITGIDGIGPIDARNLYDAVNRLAANGPAKESCGPVKLKAL